MILHPLLPIVLEMHARQGDMLFEVPFTACVVTYKIAGGALSLWTPETVEWPGGPRGAAPIGTCLNGPSCHVLFKVEGVVAKGRRIAARIDWNDGVIRVRHRAPRRAVRRDG